MDRIKLLFEAIMELVKIFKDIPTSIVSRFIICVAKIKEALTF
jgi:hypothetical protein